MQDIHDLCRSDMMLYLGANKQSPDLQPDPLSFVRWGPIHALYWKLLEVFDESLNP